MEFAALPLCPPAPLEVGVLPFARCSARAPVPRPADPLRPGYLQMVPSAAVHRNSREVPMLPITTVPSASYRLFGHIQARDRVSIRHPAPVSAASPCGLSGNVASQRFVGARPPFAVLSDIIGSDINRVNRKVSNKSASRPASLPRKPAVIHSSPQEIQPEDLQKWKSLSAPSFV